MMPVPMELPIRAGEASSLADLIFDIAGSKPMNDGVRNQLGLRAGALNAESFVVKPGSLAADPIAKDTFYLAVDAIAQQSRTSWLLHIARANAPASGLFPKPLLIGRMQTRKGNEIVVNAIPFTTSDSERILMYAGTVDRGVLPKPQGAAGLLLRAGDGLDEVFSGYRAVLRKWGLNVAAIEPASMDALESTYHEALWAAIRGGWRDGFAFSSPVLRLRDTSPEALRDIESAIQRCSNCTRLSIDVSALAGAAVSAREIPDLGELAEGLDDAELPLRYGRALFAMEELIEFARGVRAQASSRVFDVDARFDGPDHLTRPRDTAYCLHWLRHRGRGVQTIAMNLGFEPGQSYPETMDELASLATSRGWPTLVSSAQWQASSKPFDELLQRAKALRESARQFGGSVALDGHAALQEPVLGILGEAFGGRLSYRLPKSANIAETAALLRG